MIIKNQSLLIAFDTETQTVKGAQVRQDLYEDNGTPITNRTKPLSEVELAETIASIDAAVLAERDSLNTQVETLTNARDEALAANAPLAEQVEALQARIDELTAVPEIASITPRQAKLALYGAGLLDQVEAAVANADRVVQIHYQDATVWTRNDPVLAGLANALGISDEQLDQLFATAAEL